MEKFSKYSLIVLSWLLLLPACGGGEKKTATAGEEKDAKKETPEIVVSREQYVSAGMSLAQVDTADFYVTVHANGYIRVLPQSRAAISPYEGGFVKSIHVLPGKHVKKGEVLITLTNPAYVTMQQNYLEAKAQLGYLKKEYSRQKKLSEENIASLKNLQKTESDYRMTLAKYNGLREQLKLLGIPPQDVEKNHFTTTVSLRAPIDGVVVAVNTLIGAFVSPEDVIVKVSDLGAVFVELDVYENDVLKVQQGQQLFFHMPGHGDKYTASIYQVSRTIDDQTRTVKVYAKPGRKDLQLLEGMYLEADILTGKTLCAYLPEEAVVAEGERYVVLMKTGVRNGDLLFRKTEVKTGRKEEGRVEILNPEVLGDHEVLVKGAFFLL